MIYKVTIRDGKSRERNGKIIALLYNNGNVESIDVRDIWGFEFSSDGNGKFDNNDDDVTAVIVKNKEIVDVYADNNNVIACDMKSVSKYVEDGGLDVIVFSLSLMGKNWYEYMSESSRCLNTNGILIIVDTTHSLTEGRLSTLRDIIREQGFDIHKDEPWDVFTYIEAIKQ
jgi:hypothetical protein